MACPRRSGGDSAAPPPGAGPGTAGGPQSVDDSVFTVQIGALELFAPVRVASDGDSSRATESGGPQSATDSVGTAQVSSLSPDAPVRVVSDGNDASSGSGAGSANSGQTTQGSIGTVQIGAGGAATTADVPGEQDGGKAVLPPGSEEPAGSREALRETAPALELADDTDPNGSVLINARAFEPAAAGSQADSLPFTGGSLAFLGLGLALFAAGFAVRFAIVPRGALA